MKILIVEDDQFYAQRLSDLISDRGFGYKIVSNVQAALKAPLKTFGGIIIDMGLPNDPKKSGISNEASRGGYMSGVALCREIRKRGHTIPLILLSSEIIGGEAAEWAAQNNMPFVFKHDGQSALIRALERVNIIHSPRQPQAFIVHGHDEGTLSELKNFVRKTLSWQDPIVLREQASRGKTLIEKFEEHAEKVDCVFVLLTPDDKGINRSTNDEKRRARQNVIFELGFFYAQFGRKSGRVFALRKGPLELPSDMQGIVWIDISNGIKAASRELKREVAHIQS
jgi:predicted nucleotide-binding protein